MTDRYVDVNSQSNLHADKNMSTKDFDNLGIYGKERMSKPRKRNKNLTYLINSIIIGM